MLRVPLPPLSRAPLGQLLATSRLLGTSLLREHAWHASIEVVQAPPVYTFVFGSSSDRCEAECPHVLPDPTVIGLLRPPSPNERCLVALANQHYLMPSGCRLLIARCSLQRHMHAALRRLAGTRVFAGFTGQAREHDCFVGSTRLWSDSFKVSPTCTQIDVLASMRRETTVIGRRISSARLELPRGTVVVRLENCRGKGPSELIHRVHNSRCSYPHAMVLILDSRARSRAGHACSLRSTTTVSSIQTVLG